MVPLYQYDAVNTQLKQGLLNPRALFIKRIHTSLYSHIILNGGYATNSLCYGNCTIRFCDAANKATQLNFTFEGHNIDI